MKGYKRVGDKLLDDASLYTHLKADQLVKHALGLRTQCSPGKKYAGSIGGGGGSLSGPPYYLYIVRTPSRN